MTFQDSLGYIFSRDGRVVHKVWVVRSWPWP